MKGVAFDGAAGFTVSAAGGCSDARLGVGAGRDSTDFAGAPNVKGGARDGVAAVGFSLSFGNVGAPNVEDVTVETGVGVANADIGCDGAPNSDGVALATFGTCGTGTSASFDCSTAGTVRDEDGRVVSVAGLAKTEAFAKKFGIPEDVGVILDADATIAGRVGVVEATLTISGVGGMSDIVGRAGVGDTVTEAPFTASAGGGTGTGAGPDAGFVRENGSETIGGSFAWVRSCIIVV